MQEAPKPDVQGKNKASDASLKTLIEILRQRVKKLEVENRKLKQQNAVADGSAEVLEAELDELRRENQRLIYLLVQRDTEIDGVRHEA